MPHIRCEPLGLRLEVPSGAALGEALFPWGVEFPCGGRGRCRGCRVTVLSGDQPPDPADERAFTAEELAAGQRLACRIRAQGDLVLRLERYESPVLCDDTPFAFTPRSGLGVAVDLGTTTIACQLVDLGSGAVLGVRSGLNPQARHGADLVTRLEYTLHGHEDELRDLIRSAIGDMVVDLAAGSPVQRVIIVGNTVMHHLFCGIDATCLALHPFESPHLGERCYTARDLGWSVVTPEVVFLPCLGGLVGADLLAGILATGLDRRPGVRLLLDLGTNGEIVCGGSDGLWCASTAAGPAFEGARIARGMRAASGAICAVEREDDRLRFSVIGGGPARGICGSGLVAAVAAGLDLGRIEPSGRFADAAREWSLRDGVTLVQRDLRELQLAKGAVQAGARILAQRCGRSAATVDQLILAGAFGNFIPRAAATRIGLIEVGPEAVLAAGNTALLGAKLALFADDLSFADLRRQVRHLPLGGEPGFEDAFIDGMAFPQAPLPVPASCSGR